MRTRKLPVILLLLFILCTGAEATSRALMVVPELLFNGRTAECSVMMREAGKEIEATLELWEGDTLLDSWTDSGISFLSIEGHHRATSGETYTVKVYGTVNGESFTATPLSKTCP